MVSIPARIIGNVDCRGKERRRFIVQPLNINRRIFSRKINQVSLKNFRFTLTISFFTGDISSQNVTIHTSGRVSSGKIHGPLPFLRNMQSEEKNGCSFSRHVNMSFTREGFNARIKTKSQWLIIKSNCTFLQQIPPHCLIHRVIRFFDFSWSLISAA